MNKLTNFLAKQDWLLLLALLAAGGCVPFFKGNVQNTKPNPPVPYHETWCYRTLGYPDCYAEPQNFLPESLINVDPAAKYPPTPEAYRKTLGEGH